MAKINKVLVVKKALGMKGIRSLLLSLGCTVLLLLLPVPLLAAGTGGTATLVVAASNAPANVKANADYVCDGTGDDSEIQTAINSGAKFVQLSEGTFSISNSINIPGGAIERLSGASCDRTILLRAAGVTSPILQKDPQASVVFGLYVSDVSFNGNYTSGNVVNGTLIHLGRWVNVRFYNSAYNAGYYASSGTEYNTFINCLFGHGGGSITQYGCDLNGVYNYSFYNCIAATLADGGVGYRVVNSNKIMFYNCTLDEGNMPAGSIAYAGWHISGTSSRIYLYECESYANPTYRRMSIGFNIEGPSVKEVYFYGCESHHLGTDGSAFCLRSGAGVLSNIHFDGVRAEEVTHMFLYVGNFSTGNGFQYVTVENSYKGPGVTYWKNYYQTPYLWLNARENNNNGYTSQNSGAATITSGSTTVNVSHGLSAVPTRVQLTPITDTGGKRYWVSARNGTTFTISINSSNTSNISFDWRAFIEEGN